jgi:hypothetical protein
MAELKFPKASVFRAFKLQTELIDPPVITLELTPAGGKERLKQALGWAEKFKGKEDIKKLSPRERIELLDVFEDIIPIVSRHIIGWDLTISGAPIPCTDEEKAKWLEPLLWEMVEPEATVGGFDSGDDEEKTGGWLWSAIMEIISDRRNFLKN